MPPMEPMPQPEQPQMQQTTPSPSSLRGMWISAIVAVIVAIAAGAYWLFSSRSPVAVAAPKVVGIIQNVQHLDPIVQGFKDGLTDAGYVEGENVTYVYENADGVPAKLDEIAQKYVNDNVDLIYALTPPAVLAAMKATKDAGKEIPIVFTNGYGLVEGGTLDSYQSSGTYVTGVVPDDIDVTLKKLEFYKAINPNAKKIGVFFSSIPALPLRDATLAALKAKAPELGMEIVEYDIKAPPTEASTAALQKVADAVKPGDIDAIVTIPDLGSNFQDNPKILIDLSKRVKAPVLFLTTPRVFEGGLLAYSEDYNVFGRQAGAQAAKIFSGVKPIDIPIEKTKKNILIINMETAKELGLTIPQELLFVANQVIPAATSSDE